MISREIQLAAAERIAEYRERHPDHSCKKAYEALYPDQVSLDDFRQVWQHVTQEPPQIEPPEKEVGSE